MKTHGRKLICEIISEGNANKCLAMEHQITWFPRIIGLTATITFNKILFYSRVETLLNVKKQSVTEKLLGMPFRNWKTISLGSKRN